MGWEIRDLERHVADNGDDLMARLELSDKFYRLGDKLLRRGDFDESARYMDKSIECCEGIIGINPHFFGAYKNLGRACFGKGEMGRAVEAWENALRVRTDDDGTVRNLAIAYYNLGARCHNEAEECADLGRLNKAIGFFRKSLEVYPDDGETLVALGIASIQSDEDGGGGLDYLERAKDIDDRWLGAYYEWGRKKYFVGHRQFLSNGEGRRSGCNMGGCSISW